MKDMTINPEEYRQDPSKSVFEIVPTGDVLLTIEQACEYLQVSISTFRHWRSTCTGPRCCRIGGQIRILWSDLQAYIAESRETAA